MILEPLPQAPEGANYSANGGGTPPIQRRDKNLDLVRNSTRDQSPVSRKETGAAVRRRGE